MLAGCLCSNCEDERRVFSSGFKNPFPIQFETKTFKFNVEDTKMSLDLDRDDMAKAKYGVAWCDEYVEFFETLKEAEERAEELVDDEEYDEVYLFEINKPVKLAKKSGVVFQNL